jgi:hypothetical protein
LFLGDLIQRSTSFDTGVVKGDIQTIVGCQDEINSCPDIGILGEIGFEEGRGTAALLDLGDDFDSFFFAAAGQDDLGAPALVLALSTGWNAPRKSLCEYRLHRKNN